MEMKLIEQSSTTIYKMYLNIYNNKSKKKGAKIYKLKKKDMVLYSSLKEADEHALKNKLCTCTLVFSIQIL